MDASKRWVACCLGAWCRVVFALHVFKRAERLTVCTDDARIDGAGVPIVTRNALLTADVSVAT